MNLKYIRTNTKPNATYVQDDFVKHITNKTDINVIVEAGSRDLLDALQLEKIYPNATILSFECNPECVEVCRHNLQFSRGRIKFYDIALSNHSGIQDFYSFDSKNCPGHDAGVSSLYQHKNTSDVPMVKIQVQTQPLKTILQENNITKVDMLCLDLQGGEYNLLLGMDDYINTVEYMIIEFDAECYSNAPDKNTLNEFITKHNFIPVYTNCDTLFKRI